MRIRIPILLFALFSFNTAFAVDITRNFAIGLAVMTLTIDDTTKEITGVEIVNGGREEVVLTLGRTSISVASKETLQRNVPAIDREVLTTKEVTKPDSSVRNYLAMPSFRFGTRND